MQFKTTLILFSTFLCALCSAQTQTPCGPKLVEPSKSCITSQGHNLAGSAIWTDADVFDPNLPETTWNFKAAAAACEAYAEEQRNIDRRPDLKEFWANRMFIMEMRPKQGAWCIPHELCDEPTERKDAWWGTVYEVGCPSEQPTNMPTAKPTTVPTESPTLCHCSACDQHPCVATEDIVVPTCASKDADLFVELLSTQKYCAMTGTRDYAGVETKAWTIGSCYDSLEIELPEHITKIACEGAGGFWLDFGAGTEASPRQIALAAAKCEAIALERAQNENIMARIPSEVYDGHYYFEMRANSGVFCIPPVRCDEEWPIGSGERIKDAWFANLYEFTCENPTPAPEDIVVPTCASKDADLFVELLSTEKYCAMTGTRDYAGEETKAWTVGSCYEDGSLDIELPEHTTKIACEGAGKFWVDFGAGAEASPRQITLAAAKCEAMALERAQNENIIARIPSEVYDGHYYFEMRANSGVFCIPPVRCDEEWPIGSGERIKDAWWSNLYEFTCEDQSIVEPDEKAEKKAKKAAKKAEKKAAKKEKKAAKKAEKKAEKQRKKDAKKGACYEDDTLTTKVPEHTTEEDCEGAGKFYFTIRKSDPKSDPSPSLQKKGRRLVVLQRLLSQENVF